MTTVKYNGINACNMSLSWFVDLALLVQSGCAFTFEAAPAFLKALDSMYNSGPQTLSRIRSRKFESFICLRVGDVMRYKGNLSAADELYAASIRVLPLLGDPWNQRGLLLAKRDVLKCLYFHYRALHCRFSFIGATSNIQKIFQEHSETTVLVDSPFVDRFLHVLSKFYFMTRIHQRLVDSLLEECITIEAIVSLLGVLSELGVSSDEKAIIDAIYRLVDGAVASIARRQMDGCSSEKELWVLALCLRVCSPEALKAQPITDLVQRLLDNEVPIRDSELTRFWLCFEDPCDRPLTAGGLARTLCAIRDGEVINRKEINSGGNRPMPSEVDEAEAEDQRGESTVAAGRRRERAESESESAGEHDDEEEPAIVEMSLSDDDDPGLVAKPRPGSSSSSSDFDYDDPCPV
ncbi:unnamed protein product, partial [Mesorhabditis spiculigera]